MEKMVPGCSTFSPMLILAAKVNSNNVFVVSLLNCSILFPAELQPSPTYTNVPMKTIAETLPPIVISGGNGKETKGSKEGSSLSVGIIAGITAGCILLLALAISILVAYKRVSKRKSSLK